MGWGIINFLAFVGAPGAFIWGWLKYARIPDRRSPKMTASLVGLAAASISVILWGFTVMLAVGGWHLSHPVVHLLIRIGIWLPLLGMLVGFFGRPKFIPAVVFASVGTVLFWYGTTMP